MESFNRGEHVIVAFLDVEKVFDNVCHNGLGYKIYLLDLPKKLCRWLCDPKLGCLTGFQPESIIFFIYVNDIKNPSHHQTNKSQFTDEPGQWALSKISIYRQNICKRALTNWQLMEKKLNPEKTKKKNILQVPNWNNAEHALSSYGYLLSYSPHIKFLGITFDNWINFTKHFWGNFRTFFSSVQFS